MTAPATPTPVRSPKPSHALGDWPIDVQLWVGHLAIIALCELQEGSPHELVENLYRGKTNLAGDRRVGFIAKFADIWPLLVEDAAAFAADPKGLERAQLAAVQPVPPSAVTIQPELPLP